MYRLLRVKPHPAKYALDADSISAEKLQSDPSLPVTLRPINHLPENDRKRIYRTFIPPSLLAHFEIGPVSWKGRGGMVRAELHAPRESCGVILSLQKTDPDQREILHLELTDNSMNGMDPNFIPLADPERSRFIIAITMNKRGQRFSGQPDATWERKKEPYASGSLRDRPALGCAPLSSSSPGSRPFRLLSASRLISSNPRLMPLPGFSNGAVLPACPAIN